MKTLNFASTFSNEMDHFVKLKQSTGSAYHSSARLLFRFDQYLDKVLFKDVILNKQIFQNYFNIIGHLCKRGFSNHYTVLQQFSSWFNQYQTNSYVLEKRLAIDRSYSRAAYIFSLDEIKTILENSCDFSKKEEIIPGLYQTFFSLLYTTGIRIGEALALNHSDYIQDEKLIHIRKGKFRKERYLVLSNSTSNRLNKYIQHCKAIFPMEVESPLFFNMGKRRLTYQNAYLAFIKALDRAGINKNDSGIRPHDFRHTFAVHRLLQWYKSEVNINAKLPFLSTYMGHVNIDSTQVYLNVAGELLQAGSERFYKFYLDHIK